MWTDGSLSKPICDRIVMRLDDYDTGRITPNNLARVLGREPLEGFVMCRKVANSLIRALRALRRGLPDQRAS